ncbi:methionyl-tRNA formyltransferase [Firmicutes bacterium CAG:238]|nr:methionyl-tRNA formyltransferase [Firmicutes bacterium CAG:238]
MKIAFMGTPEFAVTVLEGLLNTKHEVGLVATQPDKAKNRGKKIQYTPVKEKALEHNIKVLQPEKVRGNEEFLEELKDYRPDIIVVVAYGQILPKEVLELPKYGCVNVHASLLPRLRGAAPIQRAIIEGDEETGVTIMQMSEGLDTGDMLAKESIKIGTMNYSMLHDALAEIGARLMVHTLDLIEEGKISPEPQDDSKSSYAKMVFKQEGKIDFTRQPEAVERLIRGFDPWPGAFCEYEDMVMKLWKAQPLCENTGKEPGTIIEVSARGIKIACGDGALLVSEIQIPGKKRVAVPEYLKGNQIKEGIILK